MEGRNELSVIRKRNHTHQMLLEDEMLSGRSGIIFTFFENAVKDVTYLLNRVQAAERAAQDFAKLAGRKIRKDYGNNN